MIQDELQRLLSYCSLAYLKAHAGQVCGAGPLQGTGLPPPVGNGVLERDRIGHSNDVPVGVGVPELGRSATAGERVEVLELPLYVYTIEALFIDANQRDIPRLRLRS